MPPDTPIIFERWVRGLMVMHAIGGATLVGAATHQLLWCRGYLRGHFAAYERERRMARWSALLYVLNFLLGAALYPTYKVRVRVAWFDTPLRAVAETGASVDLSWLGRLFDIKEHWGALGVAAALVLVWLGCFAHPARSPATTRLYVGLSFVACATTWVGAIIGLVVASYRAVGGIP
jgi:hypothetical protein